MTGEFFIESIQRLLLLSTEDLHQNNVREVSYDYPITLLATTTIIQVFKLFMLEYPPENIKHFLLLKNVKELTAEKR